MPPGAGPGGTTDTYMTRTRTFRSRAAVAALLPFDRPHAGHGYGLVWSVPEARAADVAAGVFEAGEGSLQTFDLAFRNALSVAMKR